MERLQRAGRCGARPNARLRGFPAGSRRVGWAREVVGRFRRSISGLLECFSNLSVLGFARYLSGGQGMAKGRPVMDRRLMLVLRFLCNVYRDVYRVPMCLEAELETGLYRDADTKYYGSRLVGCRSNSSTYPSARCRLACLYYSVR